MRIQKYNINQNGFYGKLYNKVNVNEPAVIVVSDDDVDGMVSKICCKWIVENNINALAVSPEKGSKGCHSFPMEQIENAVTLLKKKGCSKIGIMGASASAMIALTAASYFHDISLTIVLTPSDFVMEGYYQDKLDGAGERPGNFESSLTYHGEPLPFLAYAYRHPEYWEKHVEESKRRGALTAARDMFDESERRHPLSDDEFIKVENIQGKMIMAGAEDDVLWNTCKYIRRMQRRIEEKNGTAQCEALIYEHATHFIFPESMIRKALPVGVNFVLPLVFKEAKGFTKECRQSRISLDKHLRDAIEEWKL